MFAKREYSEPRFCEKTTQEPQMLRDHNNRTNIEYTKMHVCWGTNITMDNWHRKFRLEIE